MSPSRRYLVFIHVAAVVAAVVILAPFAWLLISSVATPADLLERPLRWIPPAPDLDRYRQIFTSGDTSAAGAFRASLVNSTIVASCTVLVSMSVGILGAYAFARLRFRGRRLTMRLFLITYMLPPIASVIPIYLIMADL